MGILIKNNIVNQKGNPAWYESSLATRPIANLPGRMFVDSDTPSTGVYRDNGTTWDIVASSGSGTVPTLQDVTTSGSSTNVGLSVTTNGIGIGTTIPGVNRLDIHTGSGINATFNGTGTTNAALQFQLAGVGKWNLGNLYNTGLNDFILTDVTNSLNRITVKNTGQTFIGSDTTSSGLFVVNSATGDNHIVILGATAPSLRIRNAGTGGTLNVGLGISTAANNFIQGSVSGNFCIFNSNTTASPILFGIYNGTNTQEAARITATRRFLINTSVDNGYQLDVNGNTNITGNLNVTGTITGSTTSPTFTYTSGSNFIQFIPFTGTQVTVNNYTTNIDGISGFLLGTGTITGDFTSNIKNIVSFGVNVTFPSTVTGSVTFSNLKNYIGGTGGNNFSPFATVGLNFPLLEYVSPGIALNGGAVTSIDFSSLKISEGGLGFASFTNIVTATFPSLQTIGRGLSVTSGLVLTGSISLISFSIPSIINILTSINTGNAIIIQISSLITFTLPTTLKRVQGNVLITQAGLTQDCVDNILARLAGLDGTNGTTLYNSPTVTITGTSATPSATGLAAKVVLQGRGITVTTN